MIKTLGIETSCDDTSLSIVGYDGSFKVLKLDFYSQIEHQKYGGVVPEIASRLHEEKILELIKNYDFDYEFISYTNRPGLPGSLIVGISLAKTLEVFLEKKAYDINHISGHIFSVFLDRNIDNFEFPALVLSVSGGHNDLYLVEKDKKFKIIKIGQTLDDAAGEVFDKVSRMLGGPYPGGPWISKMAELYKGEKIPFKVIVVDGYNFSFSGYKNQVNNILKKYELNEENIKKISYSIQDAIVRSLAKKVYKAYEDFKVKNLWIVGGVSANDYLFEFLKDLKPIRPIKKVYSTDNGAMIGVVGILRYLDLYDDAF